jgi:hypothetical protein
MVGSVREKGCWLGSTLENPYPIRAIPLQSFVRSCSSAPGGRVIVVSLHDEDPVNHVG